MGLLDIVFSPKSGVCCGAFLAGAFFLFYMYVIFCQKGHILKTSEISGPDFVIFPQLWSLLCSVPRRGVFLFLFTCTLSINVIFMKKCDLWTRFFEK